MNKTILSANKVIKRYNSQTVLDKVNLTVSEGDIYGFVGKNGAGKSTFMKIVTGLVYSNSGEFQLFGISSKSRNIISARRNISGIIEAPAFYPHMTAFENLKVGALSLGKFNKENVLQAIESVGLENTRKKVKNYSLGMKQRLSIAQAIMNNSEFIILDEPTNGLDPQGILELRELIKKFNAEKGITFMISSHYLTELQQIINKIGILKNGKIILESDMNKLQTELKQTLTVVTESNSNLSEIEKKFNGYSFKISDNKIIFNGKLPDINFIYSVMNSNNIVISDINKSTENLENFVLNLLNKES